MCYHLGGLVQKYELVKTDDLPHLPGSQFNPGIVKDVAQNILSFLKSKATKAGHTYWLFKGNFFGIHQSKFYMGHLITTRKGRRHRETLRFNNAMRGAERGQHPKPVHNASSNASV